MKNATSFTAAVLALSFSLPAALGAQATATWQGGKPGKPADWNCAANWKEGRTPDEFSQVVIPSGKAFYPVLKTEVLPIDALLVEGEAMLTLQKGARLAILCETGRLGGIILLGKILNYGLLEIRNLPELNPALLQQIQGGGIVTDSISATASR